MPVVEQMLFQTWLKIKTELGFKSQWPYRNPRRMSSCLPFKDFYFGGPNSLFFFFFLNETDFLTDSLEKKRKWKKGAAKKISWTWITICSSLEWYQVANETASAWELGWIGIFSHLVRVSESQVSQMKHGVAVAHLAVNFPQDSWVDGRYFKFFVIIFCKKCYD